MGELCEEIAAAGQKLTVRGYALVIKGLSLQRDAGHIREAHQGHGRGGLLRATLRRDLALKVASGTARVGEMFELCLDEGISLPEGAIAANVR